MKGDCPLQDSPPNLWLDPRRRHTCAVAHIPSVTTPDIVAAPAGGDYIPLRNNASRTTAS